MAGEIAQFKTTAIELVPIAPGAAPLNSIYSDNTQSGALTNQPPSGTANQVLSVTAQFSVKQKQNLSGETIPKGMPFALLTDGSIARADSDTLTVEEFMGVTLEDIANSTVGNVVLLGPNVEGAVTGMGFAPGDPVFLSETRSYTNTLSSFTGANDRIMRVGFADCAPGAASAVATDLIVSYELISDAP